MNELNEEEVYKGSHRSWESDAFWIIVVAAFLTRLWPLAFSTYPFNNDGLTECALAKQMLASGHMSFFPDGHLGTTHSIAIPAMNLVIAYASSALGVDTLMFGQVLTAVVSVLTIGGIYLVGREFSGSTRGGITAALMGILMGTFVFTTGSVWKEAFGFGLILLVIVGFIRRDQPRFRILCLLTLMIIPLVHHLVAIVTLLLLAFPIVWGWFFAISKRSLGHRHFEDLAMVALPAVWIYVYYTAVSMDSFENVLSKMGLFLIAIAFVLLSLVQVVVLSKKNHSKLTFAPIPGIMITILLVLDYFGYIFPYKSGSSLVYLILVGAFGFFVAVAWYGTEHILEFRHRFRAVHFGLLLAPATVIGFSVLEGLSLASHKSIYRSFDFVDIFIFVGVGAAVSSAYSLRKRVYPVLATLMILFLAMSFPFGYYSGQTVGVRHDTQSYEVDAVMWLYQNQRGPHLISDERIAYMGLALADIPKDGGLVGALTNNATLPPHWFVAFDDSYLTDGVSDYPRGLVVVPLANSTRMVDASDIMYVGGPRGDRITMLATSNIGHWVVLGPIPYP